jgi:hypothetical protein
MYIWYEATSDFPVLPRAAAVLVMPCLRTGDLIDGWMGLLQQKKIYHGDTVSSVSPWWSCRGAVTVGRTG